MIRSPGNGGAGSYFPDHEIHTQTDLLVAIIIIIVSITDIFLLCLKYLYYLHAGVLGGPGGGNTKGLDKSTPFKIHDILELMWWHQIEFVFAMLIFVK